MFGDYGSYFSTFEEQRRRQEEEDRQRHQQQQQQHPDSSFSWSMDQAPPSLNDNDLHHLTSGYDTALHDLQAQREKESSPRAKALEMLSHAMLIYAAGKQHGGDPVGTAMQFIQEAKAHNDQLSARQHQLELERQNEINRAQQQREEDQIRYGAEQRGFHHDADMMHQRSALEQESEKQRQETQALIQAKANETEFKQRQIMQQQELDGRFKLSDHETEQRKQEILLQGNVSESRAMHTALEETAQKRADLWEQLTAQAGIKSNPAALRDLSRKYQAGGELSSYESGMLDTLQKLQAQAAHAEEQRANLKAAASNVTAPVYKQTAPGQAPQLAVDNNGHPIPRELGPDEKLGMIQGQQPYTAVQTGHAIELRGGQQQQQQPQQQPKSDTKEAAATAAIHAGHKPTRDMIVNDTDLTLDAKKRLLALLGG